MKCERFINRFLELDNRSMMPLSLCLHMLICPSCRKEINRLRDQLESFRDLHPYILPRDMSDKVMIAVYESEERHCGNVSYFKWLTVGFLIVSGRVLFTYSDSFAWLQMKFGSQLDLPLNIILGLAVSLYSIFFILANLEDCKKIIPYISDIIRKFS